MQTFLPYSDFGRAAEVLDTVRLNKQLLEARQIYRILTLAEVDKAGRGWVRHPAVLMWQGHEEVLFRYVEALRGECEKRGIKWDKNWEAVVEMREKFLTSSGGNIRGVEVMPSWVGNERFHRSHRFNLYRKDPIYYALFKDEVNEPCCEGCLYFWPTHVSGR